MSKNAPVASLCRTLAGLPRSLQLYPEGHPRAQATLRAALRMTRDGIRVEVDDEGLRVDGAPAESYKLETMLRDRGIAAFVVTGGANEEDVRDFAEVLAADPDDLLEYRARPSLEFGAGVIRVEWSRAVDGVDANEEPNPDPDSGTGSEAEEEPESAGPVESIDDACDGGAVRWSDAAQAILWQQIARDALRRRMEQHDPRQTWLAIVCRLYFATETSNERRDRRDALVHAVEYCGRDAETMNAVLPALSEPERREIEELLAS